MIEILFGICIEINVFLEKGCFVCYINDILLGIFLLIFIYVG